MNLEVPRNTVARADTQLLASISHSQASRFLHVFIEAGYLPPSPDKIPEILELRARGGRNLPRLLRLTSELKPVDILARLFLLGVPVPVDAARSAMTTVPLEEWCEAGLAKIEKDCLTGLVAIIPFEGLLLATEKPELLDRGADADYVSVITLSTASLARFVIERPFPNVLDLCTGCGVIGFLAARQGGQVLATDLNPRAVQMAAFNAKMNGIHNVRFAAGSGFEPAGGRRFDLITANPPCVLGPSARYTFRDSGEELDSLCRKIIAAAPDHLTEKGIFQCTLEWPNLNGADWRERISEVLQNLSCDALVLHLGTKDASFHAEETCFDTDVLDFEKQSKLYAAYMDYFQNRGVTSISEGLLALRRRNDGSTRIYLENLMRRSPNQFGSAVFQFFEISDALDRIGEGLFDLKPRMAPSLSVESLRLWEGASWEEGSYRIRQCSGFELEAVVDASIANLVRKCEGNRTLRDLATEVAADAGVHLDTISPGCLKVIRAMLQRGFLVL